MGVSTDAILAWGYAHDDEWSADDEDFWENVQRPVEDDFGVDIGDHCSDTCGMPYVAVTESLTKAWRGHPRSITSLEVKPEWREALAKAMAFLKEKQPGLAELFDGKEPGWFLVSYWG